MPREIRIKHSIKHVWFGRINAFDFTSVKELSKKNKELLNHNNLAELFRTKSHRKAWNTSRCPEFPTEESRLKYIDNMECKIIKMTRFFLRNGNDPNNEVFLKHLCANYYHSKLFAKKILQMCINHGLDVNFVEEFLKKHQCIELYSTWYPTFTIIHHARRSQRPTVWGNQYRPKYQYHVFGYYGGQYSTNRYEHKKGDIIRTSSYIHGSEPDDSADGYCMCWDWVRRVYRHRLQTISAIPCMNDDILSVIKEFL